MSTPWRMMRREERLAEMAGRTRVLVPVIMATIALALMSVPVFTPGPALPNLALLTVIAWAMFRPDMMPPWVALPVGLMTDVALLLPPGINTVLMPLLVVGLAEVNRRFADRNFGSDWLLTGMFIVLYQLLSWQLLAGITGTADPAPFLLQAVTTSLAYPLMIYLMLRVRRLVAG